MDPALLGDVRDELRALDRLLAARSGADWLAATPAEGWTVLDTVRHLAGGERAATTSLLFDVDPVTASPPSSPGPSADTPDAAGSLDAWRRARCASLRAFALCDDDRRVPWGGRRMAARSLAVARLMETWAHGLDCAAALGVATVDTDRLRHVAWLGYRTLSYAFARADVAPVESPGRLRLVLDAPGGGQWRFGPDAGPTVRGPAGDWCRLVTHRLRPPAASRLQTDGELADQAVAVARAFL